MSGTNPSGDFMGNTVFGLTTTVGNSIHNGVTFGGVVPCVGTTIAPNVGVDWTYHPFGCQCAICQPVTGIPPTTYWAIWPYCGHQHCCECTKRALEALGAKSTPAVSSTEADKLVASAKARIAEIERKLAEAKTMEPELERLRKMVAAAEGK